MTRATRIVMPISLDGPLYRSQLTLPLVCTHSHAPCLIRLPCVAAGRLAVVRLFTYSLYGERLSGVIVERVAASVLVVLAH